MGMRSRATSQLGTRGRRQGTYHLDRNDPDEQRQACRKSYNLSLWTAHVITNQGAGKKKNDTDDEVSKPASQRQVADRGS
jgi:hypothetical protein